MSSSDQALAYVRSYYRVPARRGQRVLYEGTAGDLHLGTITGGADAHLIVRFDKAPKVKHRLHPTWHVQYLATMWRCTDCGTWSHARRRPKQHRRFVDHMLGLPPGATVLDVVEGEYVPDADGGGGWVIACGPFERWEARSVDHGADA